jgi:monovalent cation/proton antiporter MnhG/PhaG subunit
VSAVHLAALVLLWLGVAVMVFACLGVALFPDVWAKLHALSAFTSAGALLTGIAIAVQEGPGHTGGTVAFIAFVLLVSGPIITSATARTAQVRTGGRPPVHEDGEP